MVIKINQELCTGCGVCMDACSFDAIQLVDQRAAIDDGLCTQCEACIAACPNGAIITVLEPAQLVPVKVMTVTATQNNPEPIRTVQPAAEPPSRVLATLAGTTLAYLGREIAPRLVDVLIGAFDRRLNRSKTSSITPTPTSLRVFPTHYRGKRRQVRYRGNRTKY
jgi:NAD-dependent dihydropyrimidine dehydrogenase PreA subunit